MDIITSRDNARVKEARKLLQKKYRDESGLYLIEGFHLLEEAVKAVSPLTDVFVISDKAELVSDLGNITLVSPEVLATLADEKTAQGVVAVVKKNEQPINAEKGRLLILENVQDPGNVGTMIRTADAAGFNGVICVGDSADIYSPKVLRSAQGSHFHLPVVRADRLPKVKNLLVSTLSANSLDYRQLTGLKNFALVMGNEARGVSDEALAAASVKVHIPMPGHAESLNVAVAAGILMFALR
jgi:TrmH family RNA methyltransferase